MELIIVCGILLSYEMSGEKNSELFSKALNSLSHRGPDAGGILELGQVILGHVRLSILDLSDRSDQPFNFENYSMIYNGEVFNYIELRNELKDLGHTFNTNSDTEVVLHAFKEWGISSFERFNGMWALAIYNKLTDEITVARDRFGMKPLFIYNNLNSLIVSSEIEPVTILKNDLTRNYSEILAFLREGTHKTRGATFFEEIAEVQPASVLVFKRGKLINQVIFWDYPTVNKRTTDKSTLIEFDNILEDAVRLRMRSDVPVATLISGGLDSTIISALARENGGETSLQKGFCYGSEDAKDEQQYAATVADRLGLDLTIKKQSEVVDDYFIRLESLVKRLGKAHSSPAIVTISHLYEEVAKNNIKVALDGQGADELLGGYKNYFLTLLPYYLKKGDIRNFFLALKDQLKFGFLLSILLWLRVVLPEKFKKIGRRVYGYEKYLHEVVSPKTKKYQWTDNKTCHEDSFNRYLIEQHKIGLTNLLYYGDIISMNYSVENRSPFMDHRLVDYVFSSDGYLKVRGNIDKYALRRGKIYGRFIDVLERKKIGFASPLSIFIKIKMIEELKTSKIMNYPILKKSMVYDLGESKFLELKWERFLFRVFQVHLWENIYFSENLSNA